MVNRPFAAIIGGAHSNKGSPMRKLLLSAAATMLIAGPASAADLAVKAPPPGAAYIASPWDGLYIGGNLGYGATDFEVTASGFGTLASEHANGVVGGFQAGYNKQYGTFVLGLETDFELTSIKNTTAVYTPSFLGLALRERGLASLLIQRCSFTALAASLMVVWKSRCREHRSKLGALAGRPVRAFNMR